jgi:GNAT superfamily N-acetyltransferase
MPIPPLVHRARTAPADRAADRVQSRSWNKRETPIMKYIPVEMIRDNMDHLPDFSCPAGYTIRTFVPGNERLWAQIEADAGEFDTAEEALAHFNTELGPYEGELAERCFFLEDPKGNAIGTATAWYGTLAGEACGRVHWVGIVPSYQGKKLSKPLLSAVMACLAKAHQKAYLTTQTTSYPAVNLYLSFGFSPYLGADSGTEGWLLLEEVLHRKIL